jgi:predicted GNAT superfamily acetyltransferase
MDDRAGGGRRVTAVVVRDLRGMAEYRRAFAFQDEVWGPGFTEGVPASLQKVAQRVGGVAAGAFDGDDMVGFVFGITGVRDGRLVHWSDILAVRPGYRDAGIGRRLKWHQRERALEAGAETMAWTWDPLESRNAFLNLERLGVVAEEYVEEMYGRSSSPLHIGIGTDRFVALWELASPRVETAARGEGLPPIAGPAEARRAFDIDTVPAGHPLPAPGMRSPERGMAFRVPIPENLQALKADAPEVAFAWRLATRQALAPALAAGWRVVGLDRVEGALPAYRLLHADDTPPFDPSR